MAAEKQKTFLQEIDMIMRKMAEEELITVMSTRIGQSGNWQNFRVVA
jgi:hypothetical protein